MGWAAHEHLGLSGHLATDDEFCWLPPDSVKAGTLTPGVRTSNSSTIAWVWVLGSADVQPGALGVRRLVLVAEAGVLPQQERHHEAILLAVLGDVADAAVAPRHGLRGR